MATYKQLQAYTKKRHGFVPKTCHIAHVKEIFGLKPRKAPNRHVARKVPCPPSKIQPIRDALRYFKMIS